MVVTRGRCLEGAAKRFVLMPGLPFLPSQPGLKGGSRLYGSNENVMKTVSKRMGTGQWRWIMCFKYFAVVISQNVWKKNNIFFSLSKEGSDGYVPVLNSPG